jgi:four helix bundle protein
MDLAAEVYRLTDDFPKHELYGLTSQIRRAAVSVLSNIAEGSSRDSTREFLYHVSIAAGSLAELEAQLLLSMRLEYAKGRETERLLAQTAEVGKMLRGLQRSLRSKASASTRRNPFD